MNRTSSRGGADRRLYACDMKNNILGQNFNISRGVFRDDERGILIIVNTYENEDVTENNRGESKDCVPDRTLRGVHYSRFLVLLRS